MNNLVSDIKSIQGITKMLITRASIMNNDIIRIDTVVSSALDIPPDLERIARAENFAEDGKIDARRDVWQTINNTIDPSISEMKKTIIRLTDQLRLLDQDMIRLKEKVDTVTKIRQQKKDDIQRKK